jgi:hypothetical protein
MRGEDRPRITVIARSEEGERGRRRKAMSCCVSSLCVCPVPTMVRASERKRRENQTIPPMVTSERELSTHHNSERHVCASRRGASAAAPQRRAALPRISPRPFASPPGPSVAVPPPLWVFGSGAAAQIVCIRVRRCGWSPRPRPPPPVPTYSRRPRNPLSRSRWRPPFPRRRLRSTGSRTGSGRACSRPSLPCGSARAGRRQRRAHPTLKDKKGTP